MIKRTLSSVNGIQKPLVFYSLRRIGIFAFHDDHPSLCLTDRLYEKSPAVGGCECF
ncbi:hypothetical protein TTHERM_001117343 (macronuclear) [Tetrahymena thermophila SB210]|uniref:Uncharacterized protein n=1 Tax=Tetrahymena thermophila (strain SB210) TaxID=312017 RepID=W7X8J4_TETTS|nr:hypothetical protein TTHERM_001117343 [Tetrahymena thermophila SB210]EWS72723.1 hypothetical protein TTHERM_001117343 [Tetrahymena thermophila SB210]|eukprot:XP_012654749.1 hypothetical protein TTHERM_001117343 [Tetrahymena thermophila SB210]